ncbi:MAG TPA: O-antigen ligase family protein [candidate division Zixibacteria bacterium]|nr:O-antigen ligase family protein [candidate division Zixibacteria bacterium]
MRNKFDLIFILISIIFSWLALWGPSPLKNLYLPAIFILALSTIILYRQQQLSLTSFLALLIIYTAPLEKVMWKIGFALRPVMLFSFAAFYFWGILSFKDGFKIEKKTQKLLILWFVLILTFLLSGIFSLNPVKSMRVTILHLTLFLILFLIVQFVKNRQDLVKFTQHWMVIGFILCLYGLVEYLGSFIGFDIDRAIFGPIYSLTTPGQSVAQRIFGQRIYSLFGDPNNFAGFLNTIFPFFLCSTIYFAKLKQTKRFFWFLLATLTVFFVFIMTLSRSGWLGLTMGLLVVAWYKRAQIFRKGNLKYLAFALIVFIIFFAQIYQYTYFVVSAKLEEMESRQIHLYLVKSAFQMFLSHPLTGVGIGNFGEAYGRYFKPGYEYYNAHSAFLTILSETGIIGFIIYISFYIFVLRQILLFFRNSSGYHKEVIGLGLLSGFCGLMAANIFYQNFTFQFFFVFLGLAFASGIVGTQANPNSLNQQL